MSVNPAAPFLPDNDQTDMTALLLAAAVHILLVGALFFSVQWRSQAPTAVAVEVWRSGPAPLPAPVIKPEPLPEPPPPPKVEAKPEPKPLPPKVETPPVKPDIAVKEEKKKKEEPKKPEPKPVEVKKEEPKNPDPKKEEPKPERRNFDDDIQRELKRVQQEKVVHDQRARADAELRQLGQAQAELAARETASALQRGLASYMDRIRGKIKSNIVLPPGLKGNPEGIFDVTQLPTGEIINVKISKSTGSRALDEAIERAIRKSDPLPLPDQPELFKRELKLKYKPFDE